LLAAAHKADDSTKWKTFVARYESEMARPETSRLLDTLAALSHHVNFSVGCYCESENRCHRGILRQILRRHGAQIAG
jgi:uncharacterized protein YeaO (DUF488 family)